MKALLISSFLPLLLAAPGPSSLRIDSPEGIVPSTYLQDAPDVVEAKSQFNLAFKAAESKALAAQQVSAPASQVVYGYTMPAMYTPTVVSKVLAPQAVGVPLNTVQAPVYSPAVQFIQNAPATTYGLAPGNAVKQAPAPVFTGKQIPNSYLADAADVAMAKSAFQAAFDSAKNGGLAAKQAPAPLPASATLSQKMPDSFLPDSPDVALAKAAFKADFDKVLYGGASTKGAPELSATLTSLSLKAPAPKMMAKKQIPNVYLPDTPDVAMAKAAFETDFENVKIGGLAAKGAPALSSALKSLSLKAPAPQTSVIKPIPNSYLPDTADVATAKAAFKADFNDAKLGVVAAKPAPKLTAALKSLNQQISSSYLPDSPDVAMVKAAFKADFDSVRYGGVAAKGAAALTSLNQKAPAPQATVTNMISDSYLPDTSDVAEAKAAFKADFNDAKLGGLSSKSEPKLSVALKSLNLKAPAPQVIVSKQVSNSYLPETPDVAMAKAAFKADFDQVKYGGATAKGAPALSAALTSLSKKAPAPKTTVAKSVPISYLADTPDVVKAKSAFKADYQSAKAAGPTKKLSATLKSLNQQMPNRYLPDTPDVAMAKAAFKSDFDKVKYGGPAVKGAPALSAALTSLSKKAKKVPVSQVLPVSSGQPVVTGGYLSDTAEVALAKANFKSAFETANAQSMAAEQVPASQIPVVKTVAASVKPVTAFDAVKSVAMPVSQLNVKTMPLNSYVVPVSSPVNVATVEAAGIKGAVGVPLTNVYTSYTPLKTASNANFAYSSRVTGPLVYSSMKMPVGAVSSSVIPVSSSSSTVTGLPLPLSAKAAPAPVLMETV